MSERVLTRPLSISCSASRSPSPRMSSPAREAKYRRPSFSCAGQEARFGQRSTASSGSRTASDPQAGQRSGISKGRSAPVRRSFSTATTSGMISAALRTRTTSPTRTSLRRISSSLCRPARCTTVPAKRTGSRLATGVRAPVRPTEMSMLRILVRASSGGYL